MKKVLLSLITAIVCLPMAFGQINAGHEIKTYHESACGSFYWSVTQQTYTTDTTIAVTIGDTIHVLDFTLDSAVVDTTDAIELTGVCGVKWRDSIFTTAGTFIHTLHLSNGCDSIVKLDITLSEASGATYDTIDTMACAMYIAPWGDTLTATCDSAHVGLDSVSYCTTNTLVRLNIKPVYLTAIDTTDVTAGCYYTFNGVNYSDTNVVHTDTLTSVYGCDSVASIRITSFAGVQRDSVAVRACGRYIWDVDGEIYRNTGIYYDTTISEDSTCTTINILNLTLGDKYDTIVANKCASHSQLFRARTGLSSQSYTFTVTESGIYTTDTNYTDTLFPDANLYSLDILTNCITHHTLDVTIMQPVQRIDDVVDTTACNSFRFRVGTQSVTFTHDADTTLVYHRHNAPTPEQCYDQYGEIHLTIHHTSYHNDTVATCDSYTWPFNGKTYYRSATITDTVKETVYNLTDSIAIIDSISGDTTDFEYVYDTIVNIVYNEFGCDSLGRLRLTINPSPEMTIAGDWMLEPGQLTTLKAVCANINSGLRYQWYKDGVAVPQNQGGTRDSLVVEAPGTMSENSNVEIRLTTTTNKGCVAENWITITSNDMGIEDIESIDVNIYPNPAVRIVNLSSDEVLSEVVIYNAIGQTVVRQSIDGNQTQLDLGSLASGNYTLRIIAANGEQTTRKLIVNK